MSNTVTGAIQAVSVRRETKAGKALRSPLYSFNIEDVWYNCGFSNPAVSKGDRVSFEFSEDAYGKVCDVESLVTTASGASGATSPAMPVRPDSRQNSIVYQSSRKDAINVATIVVSNGLLKLPAAKADQVDALLGFIESLTDDFAVAALTPEIKPVQAETKEVVDDE
ncbi:MAG: hypothetical protein KAS32_04040 [Candidatus Peribacteraceae bacterium]|nr:hypothetical protein [Candidatus Peribacteraceae bacterium]